MGLATEDLLHQLQNHQHVHFFECLIYLSIGFDRQNIRGASTLMTFYP